MTKFSIILPVFNKEQYIIEAIESVIKQTLDFKKHIELIIVNDGSTDNSSEICLAYKKEFPENIKYIEIENSGPAVARTIGCNAVSSKVNFIGFLDADDKLQVNALEKVSEFFQEYEVDLAVIPVKYFSSTGIKREHSLNYRFSKGSRIINIKDEYNAIHFYAGGVFFRKSVFDNNQFYFDKEFSYWEDALSINMYLIKYQEYGVVSGTFYFYRREKNESSLVDRSWYKKERYEYLVNNAYMKLINCSIKNYGQVEQYIQFLLTYHIKLYLYKKGSKRLLETLSVEERVAFIHSLIGVLQYIDNKIILEQNMKHYYKEFLISLKENGWPLKLQPISINGIKDTLIIQKKRLYGFGLLISGYFTSEYYSLKDEDCICVKSKGKVRVCSKIEIDKKVEIWGETVRDFENAGFEVYVPLNQLNLEFFLNVNGGMFKIISFNYYERLIKKLPGLQKGVKKKETKDLYINTNN